MAILMCKNTEIYDSAKGEIHNDKLCPFLSDYSTSVAVNKANYKKWKDNRAFLRTNRMAEQIVKNAGTHATITKRRLSLSDSFWIRHDYDKNTDFEDITPYKHPFSELSQHGDGTKSVPERVLGGAQQKRWLRDESGITYMCKLDYPEHVHREILAVKLARKVGLPVMNAFIETPGGKIYADDYTETTPLIAIINIVNMTDTDYSLVQLDQMNIGVQGLNPCNVAAAFVRAGAADNCDIRLSVLSQIIFDGIVGNHDRQHNNSNWAVMMCNRTGERKVSPMYDFNWADLTSESRIITGIAANIRKDNLGLLGETLATADKIKTACKELNLTLWESNAENLIRNISH
jgi:hypothetical protein